MNTNEHEWYPDSCPLAASPLGPFVFVSAHSLLLRHLYTYRHICFSAIATLLQK